MLRRYIAYLAKLIALPTLVIALSLTSIIWLTQALRYVDFIINRGLSAWDFFYLTALLVPSLLLIILPIALFVAVVFAYNRLTADSEIVVLKATGLSPWQLAKPAIAIALIVTLLCYGLAFYFMPLTKRAFKDTQTFLRDNYASVLLQEEVFSNPVDGLTVFIRDRGSDGKLKGVLVHDSRIPGQDVTMMAEEATLVQTPSGPRFYLEGGMRQEKRGGRVSWLNFDSYNLDIGFYTQVAKERLRKPDELLLHELLARERANPQESPVLRAELHRRLTWPSYAFGLALLAAAVLLRSEFNRRGQWRRNLALGGAAVGIVLGSLGLGNLISHRPFLTPLLYIAVLGLIAAGFYLLLRENRRVPPRMLAEGAVS